MTKKELQIYIKSEYPKENESCEWKEFKNLKHSVSGAKSEDVISYISAIANMQGGSLVLGVKDGSLDIVGIENFSGYTAESLPLRLLGNCTNLSSEGLEVEEIITSDTNQTVWIIHIPKHLPRKPVYAHKTAWQRKGDSLIELTPEREAVILNESIAVDTDWSANICKDATLEDLSTEAILFAREEYKKKHSRVAEEVDDWNDEQFLNKAKLTIHSKITNSTLLLLGKDESSHLLGSSVPQLTWILKDADGMEQSYEHFVLPLILSAKEVHDKIRNFKYRYMADSTLFPEEVDKYDNWILYEALHNSIAHQDYEVAGRVNIVEFPDKLVISNAGSFLAGDIQSIIERDTPSEVYRNKFLCACMVEINMIDTIGSGIKRMFSIQKKRFFPMPDYKISDNKVEVTIHGKILDEKYTKLLSSNSELSLMDVIFLDRIVKEYPISDEIVKELRGKKLIEGRKPNLYISAKVAQATGDKASYTKNRAFDKQYYLDLIMKSIKEHSSMTRNDINSLLWGKLPEYMDDTQKKNKVNNLINELSNKLKKIKNSGTNASPIWESRDV
ncbi:MAG: ATP-binding protein [Campylobacterota bacterium]|nr:ATP-binding protein [Campylobacterota bacterium]